MKPFCIIFFCFLTTVLYLSYSGITRADAAFSFSSSSSLREKQTRRELSFSTSHHQHESHKTKVGWKVVDKVEAGSEVGYNKGGVDGDGIVYYVDYQGVSTHPTPTPKHP